MLLIINLYAKYNGYINFISIIYATLFYYKSYIMLTLPWTQLYLQLLDHECQYYIGSVCKTIKQFVTDVADHILEIKLKRDIYDTTIPVIIIKY